MIVEITSPQIIHSTKPSIAALRRCPLTIIQVLRDWIVISIIFAAHTIKHTTMGCRDAKNSDIFGLLFFQFAAFMQAFDKHKLIVHFLLKTI